MAKDNGFEKSNEPVKKPKPTPPPPPRPKDTRPKDLPK